MRNANKNLKVTTSEKDRKIKCLNDTTVDCKKCCSRRLHNFDFFTSDHMNSVQKSQRLFYESYVSKSLKRIIRNSKNRKSGIRIQIVVYIYDCTVNSIH